MKICTPAKAATNCLTSVGGTLRSSARRSKPLALTPVKREALEVPRRSKWVTVQCHAVRMSRAETAPPGCACGATTCTCVWTGTPTWPASHMASAWTGLQVLISVLGQVLPMRPNCRTCAGVMTPAPSVRLTLPVDGAMKGLALV